MNNPNLVNNLMLSYSSIISSEDYNHLMTNEHLYINTADAYIERVIKEKAANKHLQVVELGCGPARVARFIAKLNNISLTAVDIDSVFCEYAKEIAIKNQLKMNIIRSDIDLFQHTQLVDIFYSQGFHHHVEKGKKTHKYLSNAYNQLAEGGYYILSDEFIPNYTNENERNIKLVIWYSHIIAHALKNNYTFLAIEEAKTLLDDLQESKNDQNLKSQEQLELVLSYVEKIDTKAKNNILEAEAYATSFINDLDSLFNTKINELDPSMNLSRRDYKICDRVIREEAEKVGFIIKQVRSFGPIKTIGGMSIYILEK
jgi:SAM-dependent methyltransferase